MFEIFYTLYNNDNDVYFHRGFILQISVLFDQVKCDSFEARFHVVMFEILFEKVKNNCAKCDSNNSHYTIYTICQS